MKKIYSIAILFFLALGTNPSLRAQITCDPGGNLWVYANYDGGVLNIDVDVNVPNIKIGICTYEPVTVNIGGAFASNVTEVRYAGYVSTNNFHCNNSPATTTINGVPANITSINFLPPATLSNPNGDASIVCAYSCSTTSNQGGCNTADQIKAYFQTATGGTLVSYYTQYGCWSTTAYALSAGGNCCSSVLPCTVGASAGADDTICPGGSVTLNGMASGGGTTYSWSPSGTLTNSQTANPTASPTQTTTYVLTVTDGGICAAVDSVVITVAVPQASISPIPSVCEGSQPFALSGGSPAGGSWSGNFVSGGFFDPVAAGPGTHQVTYSTIDGNGCNAAASANVVVNSNPVVTLAPQPAFCLNGPPYTMANGSPSGGSYAGPGIANGQFFPSVAGIGNHTMMYAYTDPNGCSDTADVIFSVLPNPSQATISQSGIDSLYASPSGDSLTWYLNGTPFLTSTDPGILATASGSYTVVVWQDGCPSEQSAAYAFEAVGIDVATVGLKAWPSPVTATLSLQFDGGLMKVRVLDLTGRQVISLIEGEGTLQVPMQHLAVGTYVVLVETFHGRSVFKVLKGE